MKLSILYRGPLSSCNYGCDYCPFAKRVETAAEHEADRRALERFVNWVATRTSDRISVLFTPWGEALVRPRYQSALIQLTGLPNVEPAAIHTNRSCRRDWAERCDTSKLVLWTTYHSSAVSRERFVAKCLDLDRRGVRCSVGVGGLKQHAEEIEVLRRHWPPRV